MTEHKITVTSGPPNIVRRTWPEIETETWQMITSVRWKAPHPTVDDAVLLVVIDHGEVPTHATGQYVRTSDPAELRARYAELRVGLMRDIAHREACCDGTPVTRVDDWGLKVCVYCGAPDGDQHIGGRADGR